MKLWVKIVLGVTAFCAAVVVLLWQLGAFSPSSPVRRTSAREDGITVCLDAGHGGHDVGAEYDGRYEKDDNLRLTLAVGKILEKKGVNVVYTRTEDEFIELADRAKTANDCSADYFVSIHRNSADADVSGVEIWIENTAPYYEEKMAKNILKEINAVGYGESRGVKRGYQGDPTSNYLVNSATDMPSCLVEMGFITTPEDNELFDKNFDEYAVAVAKGILRSVEA